MLGKILVLDWFQLLKVKTVMIYIPCLPKAGNLETLFPKNKKIVHLQSFMSEQAYQHKVAICRGLLMGTA